MLKTHKDAYALPRIDEALEVLKGAKYFCSLDLAHGFNQIPIENLTLRKQLLELEQVDSTSTPECPLACAIHRVRSCV